MRANCGKRINAGKAALIGAIMISVPLIAISQAFADDVETISPEEFTLTFSEEFDADLDVSAWGPGTKWIAHTPWNGDFGDAKFADPEPDFPFQVKDGVLRIEARKEADGVWRSGLLSSVGRDWEGFSQKYGYFEMRAKFPEGLGLWPAFWFIGIDRKDGKHTAEIDVVEHYGHKPHQFSSGVIVWNRDGVRGNHEMLKNFTPVPEGVLYSEYNTWGMRYDAEWTRIYFNRKLVWKTPTMPEHRQPMFILINLGMGPGWPIDETPNPSFMYVDYVRAWKIEE